MGRSLGRVVILDDEQEMFEEREFEEWERGCGQGRESWVMGKTHV